MGRGRGRRGGAPQSRRWGRTTLCFARTPYTAATATTIYSMATDRPHNLKNVYRPLGDRAVVLGVKIKISGVGGVLVRCFIIYLQSERRCNNV